MGFDIIEINLVKTICDLLKQIILIDTGCFWLANPCKQMFTFRDYIESRNFLYLIHYFNLLTSRLPEIVHKCFCTPYSSFAPAF